MTALFLAGVVCLALAGWLALGVAVWQGIARGRYTRGHGPS
jgi:hypothetical protein